MNTISGRIKAITTIVFCVIGIMAFSQTKTSAKPSKSETITYIIDKLSKYAYQFDDGACYSATVLHEDGKISIIFTDRNYSQFDIVTIENRVYLTYLYQSKTTIKSDKAALNTTFSSSYKYKIPIDALDEVNINKAYWTDEADKTFKTDKDNISFKSNSKSLERTDTEKSKIETVNEDAINLRLGEANLLEKLKKAFLNLKTYCPKVKSSDPFDK